MIANRKTLLIFFILGLCLRIAYAFYHLAHFEEKWPDGVFVCTSPDEPSYVGLATTLARSGSYLTNGVGELEIIRGPAYAGFMAAVFLAFGEKLIAVLLIQAILGASLIVVLPIVLGNALRSVNSSPCVPLWSERLGAASIAFSPSLIYDGVLMSEGFATVLITFSVCCFYISRRAINTECQMSMITMYGLLLGLAILTKPVFLPLVVIAAIGDTVLSAKQPLTCRLARSLTMALVPILVVAPWTYRNYQISGRIIPVGIGKGVFLFLGTRELDGNGVPIVQESDSQLINEYMGTTALAARRIAIDDEFGQRALLDAKEKPLFYAMRAIGRCPRFWFSSHADAVRNEARGIAPSIRNLVAIFLGGLTCLGVLGFGLSVRTYGATLVPLAGIPLYLTLAHAPLGSGARYVIPAWPCVLCLASFSIAWIACRLRSPQFVLGTKL